MGYIFITYKEEQEQTKDMMFLFKTLPELLSFAVKNGFNHNNSIIINGKCVSDKEIEEVIGKAY